jgi:phosphate:Na+ symporter
MLMLIGALGLFLFGMKVMSDALILLAGNKMRAILASMTSNRVFGIFTGFLITSVIQSSSATTLMVVSFANAGLLTLAESISVIMGANIGTTITAWLITILGFKVSMSVIALPLVGLGFGLTFMKKTTVKNLGNFIVGFALLFIGLQFLKDAMPDISSNPDLLAILSRYTDLGYLSVFLFLCIGTLLTVIVQSSSATMALTLIITAQGWIPFELAAAMVLGENVGTTITANLAAIIGNYKAKQTARAHLIFNLIGVIWMLLLFYPFLRLVSWISLHLGSENPYINAAAIPVAISVFHTTFNIANTFALMWFIRPISNIVERLVPEVVKEDLDIATPKFLTKEVLQYPETVISAIQKESQYLFENAIFEIVAHALNISRQDIKSDLKVKQVIKKSHLHFDANARQFYTKKIKSIYGSIIEYSTKAQSNLNLTEAQHKEVNQYKIANRKMVEIIRSLTEIGRNVDLYLNSENHHIKNEYDKLRKKVVKVLRTIRRFRKDQQNEKVHTQLMQLKREAKEHRYTGNVQLDDLIRNERITVDMASSLFNDHDNVNDIVKNLIDVADILYGRRDPLFPNGMVAPQ